MRVWGELKPGQPPKEPIGLQAPEDPVLAEALRRYETFMSGLDAKFLAAFAREKDEMNRKAGMAFAARVGLERGLRRGMRKGIKLGLEKGREE